MEMGLLTSTLMDWTDGSLLSAHGEMTTVEQFSRVKADLCGEGGCFTSSLGFVLPKSPLRSFHPLPTE